MSDKFKVSVEDNKLNLSLDTNQDGEALLQAEINLPEAVQEAVKKGEKIEGVKLVDFEFTLAGITLILDTDQDGEELLKLNLSLTEALDESGLMK